MLPCVTKAVDLVVLAVRRKPPGDVVVARCDEVALRVGDERVVATP